MIHKSIKKYVYIILSVFTLGVLIGSIYASGIEGADADKIKEYLLGFFENNIRSNTEIFVSSLLDNLKIFFVIFLFAFFKIGTPFIMGVGCVEGFISGFTVATLVKAMGTKGILLNLSSIFSVLIFVINLMFFSAFSMEFGLGGGKKEKTAKKNYIIISLIFLTIFCVASVFDGYITTTFMKLIATKL